VYQTTSTYSRCEKKTPPRNRVGAGLLAVEREETAARTSGSMRLPSPQT
jgi:hypothetical protein